MKTYTYTVNNARSRGTYTISAGNKKDAIAKAKEVWGFWGGVNVSSFKVKK